MAKPTNEMERLGLLAAIPGIELAIAALQEQLRQMKEDAGVTSKVASANDIMSPKETSASNAATRKQSAAANPTRKQNKQAKSTEDGRDPDWKEKLSRTLKAKWAAMSPRERAAKSRALAAARAKKQALKKKLAA